MAIECSVTVSIGEDSNGALRVIRFVTGVSRLTAEAANPKKHETLICVVHTTAATYRYTQGEPGNHYTSALRSRESPPGTVHPVHPVSCIPSLGSREPLYSPNSPAWGGFGCGYDAHLRWLVAYWKMKGSSQNSLILNLTG